MTENVVSIAIKYFVSLSIMIKKLCAKNIGGGVDPPLGFRGLREEQLRLDYIYLHNISTQLLLFYQHYDVEFNSQFSCLYSHTVLWRWYVIRMWFVVISRIRPQHPDDLAYNAMPFPASRFILVACKLSHMYLWHLQQSQPSDIHNVSIYLN